MQDPPPAPARELHRTQSHIEWLLLRVSEAWSTGGAPENPRPIAIQFVGRDSLPEDWEQALRGLADTLAFYEGRRLPQEVVTAVRTASAGAVHLVPCYRWLAEQKNLDSTPRDPTSLP